MLKIALLLSILFSLLSCGKSADESTTSAILSANISLGKGDCQSAINVLESNGRQTKNAHYLKVLASAYACRAGYSAVTFFADDLALTTTPSPLGGTTIYSTSLVTTTSPFQDDFYFRDLQTAIDILLYAGGISSSTNPTVHERSANFTTDEASDINSQLLFMMLAQLGKYMHVYGNGDSLGKKGAGIATNKCFTSYNDTLITSPAVLLLINTLPEDLTATVPYSCRRGTGSSHSELDTTVAAVTRKKRLCQGVVLLNGVLNLIPSIVTSASASLATQTANITTAATAASTLLSIADPSIGDVNSTISQTICEDDSYVTIDKIETYFAFMFESVFQP